jgi:hypothetical protein
MVIHKLLKSVTNLYINFKYTIIFKVKLKFLFI